MPRWGRGQGGGGGEGVEEDALRVPCLATFACSGQAAGMGAQLVAVVLHASGHGRLQGEGAGGRPSQQLLWLHGLQGKGTCCVEGSWRGRRMVPLPRMQAQGAVGLEGGDVGAGLMQGHW